VAISKNACQISFCRLSLSVLKVLTITDVAVFREILTKICQNSPTVIVEKKENMLTIFSISTNELCGISIDFLRPFFEEWHDRKAGPLQVESRLLYNLSKTIQKTSSVKMDILDKRICFEIKDNSFKKITLTDIEKAPSNLKLIQKVKAETNLTMKTENFLQIITDLSNILDEAQLMIKKGTCKLLFSGKRQGLFVEMHPQVEYDIFVESDVCVEFPTKFFHRFLPLLKSFQELVLRLAPKAPLIIEGNNNRWKLNLVISKVDCLSENKLHIN
jgi:transcriptional regulator